MDQEIPTVAGTRVISDQLAKAKPLERNVGEIEKLMVELEDAVSRLDISIDSLTSRLGNILNLVKVEPDDKLTAISDPSKTVMGRNLQNLIDRVFAQNQLLNHLRDDLEN